MLQLRKRPEHAHVHVRERIVRQVEPAQLGQRSPQPVADPAHADPLEVELPQPLHPAELTEVHIAEQRIVLQHEHLERGQIGQVGEPLQPVAVQLHARDPIAPGVHLLEQAGNLERLERAPPHVQLPDVVKVLEQRRRHLRELGVGERDPPIVEAAGQKVGPLHVTAEITISPRAISRDSFAPNTSSTSGTHRCSTPDLHWCTKYGCIASLGSRASARLKHGHVTGWVAVAHGSIRWPRRATQHCHPVWEGKLASWPALSSGEKKRKRAALKPLESGNIL
uniref:Uncharacterized protein n=1 Tax=Anopheles merus TaxID=30066 RepID=A0A182ULR6_ANOME